MVFFKSILSRTKQTIDQDVYSLKIKNFLFLGGDVVAATSKGKSTDYSEQTLKEGFQFIYDIANLQTPYISIIHGITMGKLVVSKFDLLQNYQNVVKCHRLNKKVKETKR